MKRNIEVKELPQYDTYLFSEYSNYLRTCLLYYNMYTKLPLLLQYRELLTYVPALLHGVVVISPLAEEGCDVCGVVRRAIGRFRLNAQHVKLD